MEKGHLFGRQSTSSLRDKSERKFKSSRSGESNSNFRLPFDKLKRKITMGSKEKARGKYFNPMEFKVGANGILCLIAATYPKIKYRNIAK